MPLTCDGYSFATAGCSSPKWEDDQCWQCIDPDPITEGAIGTDVGCGIGCRPCPDYPADLSSSQTVSARGGTRFLAPATDHQGRNARGLLSDLTESTMPIPSSIAFYKAPCFDNFGEECFSADSCQCQHCYPGVFPCIPGPKVNVLPETNRCGGGEAIGEVLFGSRGDCYGFSGNHWPLVADSSDMYCRQTAKADHGLKRIVLSPGTFFGFTSHRDYQCTSNGMVACTAEVAGSPCNSSYSQELSRGTHYDGSATRQRWNICRVFTTARIKESLQHNATQASQARVKSLVLAEVSRRINQVDFVEMNLWQRFIDLRETPIDSWPIIEQYTGVMRDTRCEVPCTLVLKRASFQLWLIAQREAATQQIQTDYRSWLQVYPYARVLIRAECILRVSGALSGTPEHPTLPCHKLAPLGQEGPTLVTLSQGSGATSDQGGHMPVVLNDVLLLKDSNGVFADPPWITEWWGNLGHYSHPIIQDVWNSRSPDDCGNLRAALRNVVIPGWPTGVDSTRQVTDQDILERDKNNIYGGGVRIVFDEERP